MPIGPVLSLLLLGAALAAADVGGPAIAPGAERTVLVHLRLVDGVAQVVASHEVPGAARSQRVPRGNAVVEAVAADGSVVARVDADFQPAACACLPDPANGAVARHEHGHPEAFVRLVDRGQSNRLRLRPTSAPKGAAVAAAHAPRAQEVAWAR